MEGHDKESGSRLSWGLLHHGFGDSCVKVSESILSRSRIGDIPMPLSVERLVEGEIGTPGFSSLDTSVLIEGVEGVREKVFARGPKWVSFSSINTIY